MTTFTYPLWFVRWRPIWRSEGTLAAPSATPSERMVGAYRDYLDQVRGLAALTVQQHATSASELLGFLHFDDDPTVLPKLTRVTP